MSASAPPPPGSPAPPEGELTGLLRAWREGDAAAADELLPLVYDELRRIAGQRMRAERGGHTLQPTALVHEAFLRLVGQPIDWQDRGHFFAVASRAMRRVAVDHARAGLAQKRGAGARVDLGNAGEPAVEPKSVDVMALDAALSRLEQMSAQQARVVELRYFAGLSLEEVADVLDRSRASVFRDWRAAKTWLFRELSGDVSGPPAAGTD
ncbi:MAG TPA: sigma-70 family RNA polymerase sigma factor [Thermoanaerobaculia bacterium]|nr:sigma-70 family RNA polymerase sigma factor [Thermoanaerobaculia bacterium]